MTDRAEELALEIHRGRQSGQPVRTMLRVDDRVLARVTDGIYRRPSSAFRELISNAYDADATEVILQTDAPRFERIVVRDNGRGMSPEMLADLVTHIGGSSKRTAKGKRLGTVDPNDPKLSIGGRRLIGKIGIGMFSVSQLTQHFQVITKRRGDDYRTSAVIIMKTHTEEMLASASDGDVFETGSVTITSEPAADIEAQGTEIILMDLTDQARELLQGLERWRLLDRASAGDIDGAPPKRPTYHIGRVAPEDADVFVEEPELPWSASDTPVARFRKLYDAVRNEVRDRRATPVIQESLDDYLGMIWLLSLAVPVRYIDRHPFDLTAEDGIGFFNLTTRTAEAVELAAGQTIGERLGLTSSVDPVGGFRVLVDDVELMRPISFDRDLRGNSEIGRPLMFFGKVVSGLGAVPPESGGGALSFEAYLYWNQKITPKENNGVLVRVNNASGVLFDPAFLGYQVSELTRLRQLMSEIFITEGLDAALNIDRESFNFSHPHYQYLQKWVHFAVRQTTNKLKGLNKEILDARRTRAEESRASRLDVLVDQVWQSRRGADAEPPPTVRLALRGQALLDDRERGVLVYDADQLAEKAANRDVAVEDSQLQALAKVLSAWGLLEDLSWDEQQSLLADIAAVFGAR
ncbi:ATP-binding protein [Sphingomonas sp. dw_22]|uniref:ATP-binding protein n=1 Tax=Sphingomonas sp. dw_22 TaxID=2721175 RepID=UPI001BD30125|nr:ATP-binding protein [Sphingomonas sp. dw_22]